MARPRALSPEQEARLVELYRQTGQFRASARILGIAETTARSILKRHGLSNPNPNRYLTTGEVRRIKELRREGLRGKEIAAVIGCNVRLVYSYWK